MVYNFPTSIALKLCLEFAFLPVIRGFKITLLFYLVFVSFLYFLMFYGSHSGILLPIFCPMQTCFSCSWMKRCPCQLGVPQAHGFSTWSPLAFGLHPSDPELEVVGMSRIGWSTAHSSCEHPLFLILDSGVGQARGLPGSLLHVCAVMPCHVLCSFIFCGKMPVFLSVNSTSPEESGWLAVGPGHSVAGKTHLSFH